MDVNLLIDGVVRQTTVLIAQLATQAGNRTPLAHTANQVFLSLVQELRRQGLGNKVIADMFGMALRTYHDKVQRLSESQTFRGRSLWEAVLQYVQERETVSQSDILRRFSSDDERILRSVLSDLTDSGLLYRSGKGDQTAFRVAPMPERSADPEQQLEATAQLLWVAIHRFGPLTKAAILGHIQLDPDALERALELLTKGGKVTLEGAGDEPRYQAEHCVIPLGDPVGWEAAVFDHYQAVVTAICAKLDSGVRRAQAGEAIGGSTYTYEVWSGHPLEDEVMAHLQRLRQVSVELRHKVEAHNAAETAPAGALRKTVISYVGQTVIEREHEEA